MRKSCRSSCPLSFFAAASLAVLAATATSGCSDEEFSDEYYGAIDLAPYFFDGSTPSAPTTGLPVNVRPLRGWMNGQRAEYYDFGLVNHVRRRSTAGATLREADYSVPHPMYLFYDVNGNPMFSAPDQDTRSKIWYLRGGKDVPRANPRGDAAKNVPYSVRVRDRKADPSRGNVSDYQRPIVDRINQNTDYSGLWEIYEVKDLTGSYEPDAIKSVDTLQKAIDAKKFEVNRTGLVVDCPLIDARTYVTPSTMRFNAASGIEVPRPRVELWYKTKLGACFLVHGWEVIGGEDGKPYKYKQKAARVDSFDVIRYTIGEGVAARSSVAVPVGKSYQPTVRVANQDPSARSFDLRYGSSFLTDSVPRHLASDPPGYRPIRWLWDVRVAQDPPFEAGALDFRDVNKLDPAQISARDAATTVWTKNFPLIGTAIKCDGPGDDAKCLGGLQCNAYPDSDISLNEAPAGKSMQELTNQRENGPRCDEPQVGFGEYCAPGVARCMEQTPVGSEEDKAIASLLPAVVGPVPTKQVGSMISPDGVATGRGYICSQRGGPGFCTLRCDGALTAPNATSGARVDLTLTFELPSQAAKTTRTETVKPLVDSRCGTRKVKGGGADGTTDFYQMLGYSCQNPSGNSSTKQWVCVRTCSSQDSENKNKALCDYPLVEDSSPLNLSGKLQGVKALSGQRCTAINGFSACSWDPSFEPRPKDQWSWQ